jgi:hypothetical protein
LTTAVGHDGRGDGDAAAQRALRPSRHVARVLRLLCATALALLSMVSAARADNGWKGFGHTSWPGASWRPYSVSSPFNEAAAGALVHPRSAVLVHEALQWGPPANLTDAAGATNDWARPTYYAEPSDPQFTLKSTSGVSPVNGLRIPIPDAAKPAGGGDAHMTVVTPDGWEYDFWGVVSKPAGGGTLTFAHGSRIPIEGNGLGGEGTYARFGNLAGAIRAQELAAGNIRHALYIVLKCTGTGTSFGFGVHQGSGAGIGSYVYPAAAGGSNCATENPNLPPLGARFRLAMTATEIDALPVPPWKKTILHALARYGGYVGGTGGAGFGFLLEDSTMYTALGAPDPLAAFAKAEGVPKYNGQYVFKVASGVEWERALRVLTPPAPAWEPPSPPERGAGWGGFGGGVLPSGSWRPYASTSPFNTLAHGMTVHPESAALAKEALSFGPPAELIAGTAETTSDWSHPTFWAQPGDALYTLHATKLGWGTNPLEGMQIRIPEGARPAGGGDSHMTVVEPDGWEYDFWRATKPTWGGGVYKFAWGGRTRIDGDGLSSGATAADFGNLAGMIRAPEWAAGNINHALFLTLRCAGSGLGFGYGETATSYGSSYVYPATHGGAACGSEHPNMPPLGAHLVLEMTDTQISALAVPQWKKTVLTALAHYGGYVGDTGGPGFGLMAESGTSYTALGLPDPLVEFASRSGVPLVNGHYVFDIGSGVNWAQYLRVLAPPGY